MRRKFIILTSLCIFALMFCFDCFAGLIDWERRNRYLKDKQQELGSEGVLSEDALPEWMRKEPRVKTKDEKRHDINRDGKLQPAESKVYLRRVIRKVENGGKVVSTSEILKEYDKNKDGVITQTEVIEIRGDVF
ncbi:MAG: EF-hand domain-containing protein [Candidatus Aceula lacicola]|nr:EF-hand domain-containing protein [Candidatus Aceula lacicola]